MKTILLLSLMIFVIICNGQKTQIENVRTEIDPQELKVIVTYDLKSKNPSDSIAVRFFANEKKIKANAISGDLGYSVLVLNNRQIKWDFIKDGMNGNVNLVAEVFSTKQTMFSGIKGKVKLLGLAGTLGGGIYSMILANKVSTNVHTYNTKPNPSNAIEQQNLNTLKINIDNTKKVFYTSLSITAALLITDIIFIPKKTKKHHVSTKNQFGTASLTISKNF